MLCGFFNQLGIIIIVAVHTVLIRIGGFDRKAAAQAEHIPQPLAQLRIIGNGFRDNITGTGQCCFSIRHFLFRIDESQSLLFRICTQVLLEDQQRQRFQSPCFRNGRLRLALLLERPVNIFRLHECFCCGKCFCKLRRHLIECCNRIGDFLLALLQLAQIVQPVAQCMERLVIK